jgi:hypothetical protein
MSSEGRSRVVVVVVCLCALNLRTTLLKASEWGANEPFCLKHHAAYIRLALQMQDRGEMAANVR